MKSNLVIEIRVGSCSNIGDALMLYAIVKQLNDSYTLVTTPSIADYRARARLGLLQKLEIGRLGNRLGARIGDMIPLKARDRYGLVTEREIDVVLDANGFAYGDQWGASKVKNMAEKTTRWKKQGKKIVLLPQTFGPFENKQVRSSFLRILENANLVYARDKTSYDHVRNIDGKCDNLRFALDFTNLVKGQQPASFKPLKRQVCIIPNHRMIDSTSPEESANYLSFLKLCFQCFSELGMTPFVLLHDIKWDQNVALSLQGELGHAIQILQHDDPVLVKGIIGSCHIVLSSRLHGLINALSQGVPCLATAWAHKFQELMTSYGCSPFLIHTSVKKDVLMEKIRLLDESASRQDIIDRIKKTCEKNRIVTQQMWQEIEDVILKQ